MSNFLDKICDRIVEANIGKEAQQMSPDQKQQQEQQNQDPPNIAPKAPTAEAPKAPVAPTAEAPKAPVAPTATNPNPNPSAENKTDNAASEHITNDTKIPDDIANSYQKSGTFSGLVGDAINNSLSKKREAYNYFKQEHIKKAILNKIDGKHCVISFAGSNDMFPAKMDSEMYDNYANNGMINIFDIVDDTVKNFSISITTDEKKIMSHIKDLALSLHQLGFNCIVLFKNNTYIMQFSSDKEVKTQTVFDLVLDKINSFATKYNDSIFDVSELNKGNLRDVSGFAPLHQIMEL